MLLNQLVKVFPLLTLSDETSLQFGWTEFQFNLLRLYHSIAPSSYLWWMPLITVFIIILTIFISDGLCHETACLIALLLKTLHLFLQTIEKVDLVHSLQSLLLLLILHCIQLKGEGCWLSVCLGWWWREDVRWLHLPVVAFYLLAWGRGIQDRVTVFLLDWFTV